MSLPARPGGTPRVLPAGGEGIGNRLQEPVKRYPRHLDEARDGIQAPELVHPFPERRLRPVPLGHVKGRPGDPGDPALRIPEGFERQVPDTQVAADVERHRRPHRLSHLEGPAFVRGKMRPVCRKGLLVPHPDDGLVRGPELLVIGPGVAEIRILRKDDHRRLAEGGPEVVRVQVSGGIPNPDEPLPGKDRCARDREPAPGAVWRPDAAAELGQIRAVFERLPDQPCRGRILDSRQKMPVKEREHVHPGDLFRSESKNPRESRIAPEDPPVAVYHEKTVFRLRERRAPAGCRMPGPGMNPSFTSGAGV